MGAYGIARKTFVSDDFHFAQFDFQLDSYREYLKITNLTIEENLKTYVEEYKELGEYADYYFDSAESFVKAECLQLYYSSIIISLYSFLEQSMLRLCMISEGNQTIKISDISGKGIFQFKTYLEKVLNIDFKPINDEWNEICKYNHLRNLFVHASNSLLVKSESKKRINSIKGIKTLKISEKDNYFIIEFENDYVITKFIKTINIFLIKLYYVDFEKFPEIDCS